MGSSDDDAWSAWRPFPDPKDLGELVAPLGPGVYELRNKKTKQNVLYGSSKNAAARMCSLLPSPLGAGTRKNASKRVYVFDHLAHIEYRTLACKTASEAQSIEKRLRGQGDWLFDT